MRRLLVILFLLAVLPAFADAPVKGRIVKALPLLLNLQGHDALSPSLYDRDAYQVYLRLHTNEISAIRFDVLWSAKNSTAVKYKIRAELRGVSTNGTPSLQTLQQDVKPAFFRRWTSLTLDGEDYKQFGSLVAWRVTLLADDQKLCEQKSFLW